MRSLLGSARLKSEADEINLVVEDAFCDRILPLLETVYSGLPEKGPGVDAMHTLEALWFEREDAKVKAALASRQAVSPLE